MHFSCIFLHENMITFLYYCAGVALVGGSYFKKYDSYVFFVQSYRRRGVSVNAEINLFHIIYLKQLFFVHFLISIFLPPCISLWFRIFLRCTNIFFSQFIHPTLKNYTEIPSTLPWSLSQIEFIVYNYNRFCGFWMA